MIKLTKKLCKPKIRPTRPNKTLKPRSSLRRLEKRKKRRVTKNELKRASPIITRPNATLAIVTKGD